MLSSPASVVWTFVAYYMCTLLTAILSVKVSQRVHGLDNIVVQVDTQAPISDIDVPWCCTMGHIIVARRYPSR